MLGVLQGDIQMPKDQYNSVTSCSIRAHKADDAGIPTAGCTYERPAQALLVVISFMGRCIVAWNRPKVNYDKLREILPLHACPYGILVVIFLTQFFNWFTKKYM
jgi:hypothetical protein